MVVVVLAAPSFGGPSGKMAGSEHAIDTAFSMERIPSRMRGWGPSVKREGIEELKETMSVSERGTSRRAGGGGDDEEEEGGA